MIELKDRKYRLTVSDNNNSKTWDNLNKEGLKVVFDIKKTSDSSPNEMNLEIYNLSLEDREFFEKKGNEVTLEAGYPQDFGIIFKGSVTLPNQSTEKPNIISKIECKDGIKNLKQAVLSKSFAPNTSQETVLKYVTKELNITIGTLKGIPKGVFGNGESLSGEIKKYLDDFCKTHNLIWSIQDGVLHIYPKGDKSNDLAILLDSTSGLVGSPEKTDKGYKVKSLIRPNMIPSSYIELRAKNIKGFFIIQSIQIKGDTHGGEWIIEALVQEA